MLADYTAECRMMTFHYGLIGDYVLEVVSLFVIGFRVCNVGVLFSLQAFIQTCIEDVGELFRSNFNKDVSDEVISLVHDLLL